MRNPRVAVLGTIFVLVLGVVVWRWIANWGLVTCNFKDAPLSKVIKSIEWQGGVTIVTNADLSKPTSLILDHVPVAEALDTLSLRMDGDARLAFVAAPTAKEVKAVLAAFSSNNNPGGWTVFTSGWGGGPGGAFSDTPIDPLKITWKITETKDKNLQTILDQGAQKTGSLFAVPKDWNPTLTSLPSGGKVAKVARSLISKANGSVEQVFLITVRGNRDRGENRRPEPTVFSPAWDGNRRGGNQDWMAERVKAQIAALPADQQADAQKQVDEMRALFESVRNLPEDQRRAKFEEVMNRPDVQEKMQDRMENRDAKRTPQQREDRYRQYIQRKAAQQGGGAPSRS